MFRWVDDHRCVLGGTSFELRDYDDTEDKKDASSLVLRKPRYMVERYVALQERFAKANVLELGIHRGGSTALLALLLRPKKLVAVDIAPAPSAELTEFLVGSKLGDSIHPFYGVDQADRTRLGEILSAEFGEEPLDLVIDDASHLLRETTESFNVVFPRLRPGGLFVLEDWSAEHSLEHAIARDEEVLARIAADTEWRPPPIPMSRLLLEIVLGAGSAPEVFAHVELMQGWAAVERGKAALDPISFDVACWHGYLARRLLGEA